MLSKREEDKRIQWELKELIRKSQEFDEKEKEYQPASEKSRLKFRQEMRKFFKRLKRDSQKRPADNT